MKLLSILSLTITTALSLVKAIDSITVKGNAFWDSKNDTRFYIRGVDYQPGGSSNMTDPLAEESICDRDIPIFKELGINTIRVYSIDNSLDHTYCMNQLEDNGIYLILDVNTPDSSISRSCPKGSYNEDYLQNVFATIDAFANYTNVLGFFAGNEVINDESTVGAAPYVKAVVRDMKNYMKARSYRAIPVGYSSADIATIRLDIAEYFNCGDDDTARIDFFGINDYSWCGHSSFTVSGYSEKVSLYSNYSAPLFLSEYGCNQVKGDRPFTEVESIYSTEMTGVFSGGLVYEYSQEANNYGLVSIGSDNTITKLTDFTNLQNQFDLTADPEGDGDYRDSRDASVCPTWNVTTTLPAMPSKAKKYLKNGAGEGYGFDANTIYCDEEASDSSDEEETTSTSSHKSKKTHKSSATESAEAASSSIASSSSSISSSSSSSSSSSKSKSGSVSSFKIPNFFTFFEHNPFSLTVIGLGVILGATISI